MSKERIESAEHARLKAQHPNSGIDLIVDMCVYSLDLLEQILSEIKSHRVVTLEKCLRSTKQE
jgi:hypothetical protein